MPFPILKTMKLRAKKGNVSTIQQLDKEKKTPMGFQHNSEKIYHYRRRALAAPQQKMFAILISRLHNAE